MNIPSVAIVILNWNGRKFLEQFIPSVIAGTYGNKRVIVADNASTDDSVAFLQKNFPLIEIIQNETNGGFAMGYNSALKKIQADYYVLLNSDVEVTANWIEPVISLMESDTGIAACQPKILSHGNKHQFEYAGACGGWIDNFGYPFARGRVFDICEMDNGQYDSVQACFWASGAAMFVRSAVYHELGGLDEYFFAHQEEIDLCWRMQRAGYKVYVQPLSVVYHVGGGTLSKDNSRKTFLNFRNNLLMLYKNLPRQAACWKLPVRIMLDAIAAWKFLLNGNGGSFLAVLKAHLHFLKWLFFEKHNRVASKRKDGPLPGLYRGNIVWDHFVKKKNSFLEIIGNK
ncbi:MAG: glycosyltransferase family 2 protein [Ferruginibacter sp.]